MDASLADKKGTRGDAEIHESTYMTRAKNKTGELTIVSR